MDLTLYRDDAQLIRQALYVATARYEKAGQCWQALQFDRLRDLIEDRLRQGLHPERESVR